MNDDVRTDAATLEVLRNALDATAEEMGAVLRRTAFSPNIKERMDASCAVFDRHAQLVAQAEHVPVHLGSMMSGLAPTLANAQALEDGDVLIVCRMCFWSALCTPVGTTSAMSRRAHTTLTLVAWSRARCLETRAKYGKRG